MTKKELKKLLKKLPDGEIVVRIQNGIYYPIEEVTVEKPNTTVIECREVNMEKETIWVKV